jgi:hypothetical protein
MKHSSTQTTSKHFTGITFFLGVAIVVEAGTEPGPAACPPPDEGGIIIFTPGRFGSTGFFVGSISLLQQL